MASPFSYSDRDVAERWNANADQWTSDVRAGYDTYRDHFTFPAFRDFLPPLAGLRVIDFGCGEGTNTRAFARMGARMTGLDISERLIGHARRAEAAKPLAIDYRIGSFSGESDLPAGSFGGVVSTLALMDGPDFEGAMREACRLLRPGGFLAFSVLHPCFITPGLRWEKDEEGATTGLVAAGYFERGPFDESWRFGDRPKEEAVEPFVVPRFPRTLSDYLNAIVAGGLVLARVAEPRPTEEVCRAYPRFARWRDLAAFLLMVEARKPG